MTDSYPVCEIFYSLQGEGYFTGTPAVFVRFAGCNLKCDFCDTDHTSSVTAMTAAEIAGAVNRFPATHVVLTGGEPALRIDDRLVDALAGHFLQIETNGTVDNAALSRLDWVTCSPKRHERVLPKVDELKVVLAPGVDPAEYAAPYPEVSHLMLQPCSCLNTEEVVAYVKSHPRWRLSLQTHKYIQIP